MRHGSGGWQSVAWMAAGWVAILSAMAQAGPAPAATAPASGPATSTATAPARKGEFRQEVKLSGVLAARRAQEIALVPAGTVTMKLLSAIDHGAAVKKGQPLMRFETDKLQIDLAQRKAGIEQWDLAVRQGQQELADLQAATEADLADAALADARAQEDLQQFLKEGKPLAVRLADRDLKNVADRLEYTREELRQLEKMYKSDDLVEATEEIVLRRQRDAVQWYELELAKAKEDRRQKVDVALARQEQDLRAVCRRKADLLRSAKALAPLKLARKKGDVEKLQRDRDASARTLADLEKDLAMLDSAVAPFDGVVYYGHAAGGKWPAVETIAAKLTPGSVLPAGMVAMTVVAPSDLEVVVAAPEKDLAALAVGQQGDAAPTAQPARKLAVKLTSLSRTPMSEGLYESRLAVEGKTDGLMPGMTCAVRLTTYEKKDAITVPAPAVRNEGGKSYVTVCGKPGAEERREVTCGRTGGGRTEILSGLADGEVVRTGEAK